MLWLLLPALANDLETTTLGALRMPLTPSEGHREYVGVFEHVGAATKTWQSDAAGFGCRPNGDLLEVVVDAATWPSVVPERVTCTASDGKKVKSDVRIAAKRHEAMFVPDGTLVLPRDKKAAVIFDGPAPNPNMVVQQGKSGSLAIRCEVKAGPVLRVVVDPEFDDGSGSCTFKDSNGDIVRVPMRIVTAW